MSDFYINNPMMNFWKNFLDNSNNPLAAFAKNFEFLKNYSPMNFSSSMPSWMNMGGGNQANAGSYNFADNFKDMGGFSETQKLSFENAQVIVRRQTEILQKHAQELAKLMQKAISNHEPEEAVKRNSQYLHSTFDLLMADFKELTELYAKANMETFEAVSNRFKAHLEKVAPNACHSSCESSCSEDEAAKDANSKKKK